MEAANKREELELLFDISKIFSRHVELRSALGPVLKLLETQAGLNKGMVTLLEKSRGMLRIEEASGLTPEEQARGFFRLGEGHVGKVFETGMPVTAPDPAGLTFYCVPICASGADGVQGGAVIGTLSAERRIMNEEPKFFLARSDHRQAVKFLEKVSSIIADSWRLRERIAAQSAVPASTEPAATLEAALSRLEKKLILDALKISGGNMAAAARSLGITERQMGIRVHHYAINWKLFRPLAGLNQE